MAIFVGEAEAALDEKNRLTFPKKFRAMLQGSSEAESESAKTIALYLVPGTSSEDFVIIDEEGFLRLCQKIERAATPGPSPNDRRRLFGRVERVELDKAGRILVEKGFLDRAHVTARSFVLTGRLNYIAAHGPEKWQRLQENDMTGEFFDAAWSEFQRPDEA